MPVLLFTSHCFARCVSESDRAINSDCCNATRPLELLLKAHVDIN